MNLYCTVPFGLFHSRNPLIVEIAERMGRSPSSLAMKLCNFASLDPAHQARGVKGLEGASKGDREIWDEFQSDWETHVYESAQKLAKLRGQSVEQSAEINPREIPREGIERERFVKQRVNQQFFRTAVLAAYDSKCCITGLAVPELLVASHIIPWAENPKTRVNPSNGLCLNALHDRAFDRGFIALDENLRVMVSPALRRFGETPEITRSFLVFEGIEICRPIRFAPDLEFLAWHRKNRFQCAA